MGATAAIAGGDALGSSPLQAERPKDRLVLPGIARLEPWLRVHYLATAVDDEDRAAGALAAVIDSIECPGCLQSHVAGEREWDAAEAFRERLVRFQAVGANGDHLAAEFSNDVVVVLQH